MTSSLSCEGGGCNLPKKEKIKELAKRI